ncbi:aquaporin-3 [Clonorchis sinensis]|uniref:Aquaporin-3 n=1 Tax=Clonorchis sinensis TaxID=79923 RepID=G7YQU1_CLOSI|nr:aquaporin-3 [Clonorchis sinensis]
MAGSLSSYEYERVSCQSKYENTIHRWADKMRLTRLPLLRVFIGELAGTMILIIFGDSVVAQSIFGSNVSAFSVSFGWGFAVIFGIFISGTLGYGLLNPAIALAFAFNAKVPWIVVPVATIAEVIGAFLGGLIVYCNYQVNIQLLDPGLTTKTLGIFCTGPSNAGNLPGFYDQIIGTALLAVMVLAIGDTYNFNIPSHVTPIYIGFLISALVGALGINAGAALNPARDFGPRLAALTVGYKDAFTSYDSYCWVPIIGPYIGAILGVLLYELGIGVHVRGLKEEEERQKKLKDSDDY